MVTVIKKPPNTEIGPMATQQGAWITTVTYDNKGKPTYDPELLPQHKHLVIHDVKEGAQPCPLRKLTSGEQVSGASWDPDYQIPDPEPEQITPYVAPVNERNSWKSNADKLVDAATANIIKDFQTGGTQEVADKFWEVVTCLKKFESY